MKNIYVHREQHLQQLKQIYKDLFLSCDLVLDTPTNPIIIVKVPNTIYMNSVKAFIYYQKLNQILKTLI